MARYAHSKAERQLMFKEVATESVSHSTTCEWVTNRGRCTCGSNDRLLAVKGEALRKVDPEKKATRPHKVHA